MNPERYFKTLKEFMELSAKLTQGTNPVVKVDITQIINQQIQNKNRIVKTDNTMTIASEYPSYDEDSDVIDGEFIESNE